MIRPFRLQVLALLVAAPFAVASLPVRAQTTPTPSAPAAPMPSVAQPDPPKPLPDVNTLMRQVEANQHTAEGIERNYIYRAFVQTDTMDSNGKVKKTESHESEIFWINGIRVARRLKNDGKDLTPDEAKKESERIDKRIAEAKAKRAKAEESGADGHGNDELSFARILELGAFSNERRELYKGRPAILVDYTGDPKAKTHNALEAAFKELGGTVWIDEQDKALAHIEATFLNDFKLGGGLLVDVHKGTTFKSDFSKINEEVWLPASFEGHGSARALLFFNIHGSQFGRTGDYRKFKATSTILPGVTEVDPKPVEPTSTDPKSPVPSPPAPASRSTPSVPPSAITLLAIAPDWFSSPKSV